MDISQLPWSAIISTGTVTIVGFIAFQKQQAIYQVKIDNLEKNIQTSNNNLINIINNIQKNIKESNTESNDNIKEIIRIRDENSALKIGALETNFDNLKKQLEIALNCSKESDKDITELKANVINTYEDLIISLTKYTCVVTVPDIFKHIPNLYL